MFELHTLDELEAHCAAHGSLDGVMLQGIDFSDDLDRSCLLSWQGATVLGGVVPARLQSHMLDTGAVVFPTPHGLPFRPYRPRLYTLDELMEGYRSGDNDSLSQTVDFRIYEFAQALKTSEAPSVLDALYQRIHDHAIDDAVSDFLADHPRVVAVMGGHALHRDEATYRDVVELGRQLALSDYLVTTGGGPGAMEAANLGAWLSTHDASALDDAVAMLATDTDYRTAAYLDRGYEVRTAYPNGAESLAIPTWFYGHEPTNQFATHVAKYFSNSIREDGLLALANHGVVFTPGSAGTVQEVFQDATQNHYGTFELTSPMVFLDADFWTTKLPVKSLLTRLAGERAYADLIAFVDTPAEVIAFLSSHPPVLSV